MAASLLQSATEPNQQFLSGCGTAAAYAWRWTQRRNFWARSAAYDAVLGSAMKGAADQLIGLRPRPAKHGGGDLGMAHRQTKAERRGLFLPMRVAATEGKMTGWLHNYTRV